MNNSSSEEKGKTVNVKSTAKHKPVHQPHIEKKMPIIILVGSCDDKKMIFLVFLFQMAIFFCGFQVGNLQIPTLKCHGFSEMALMYNTVIVWLDFFLYYGNVLHLR